VLGVRAVEVLVFAEAPVIECPERLRILRCRASMSMSPTATQDRHISTGCLSSCRRTKCVSTNNHDEMIWPLDLQRKRPLQCRIGFDCPHSGDLNCYSRSTVESRCGHIVCHTSASVCSPEHQAVPAVPRALFGLGWRASGLEQGCRCLLAPFCQLGNKRAWSTACQSAKERTRRHENVKQTRIKMELLQLCSVPRRCRARHQHSLSL